MPVPHGWYQTFFEKTVCHNLRSHPYVDVESLLEVTLSNRMCIFQLTDVNTIWYSYFGHVAAIPNCKMLAIAE